MRDGHAAVLPAILFGWRSRPSSGRATSVIIARPSHVPLMARIARGSAL
jgi:hypothetical protein